LMLGAIGCGAGTRVEPTVVVFKGNETQSTTLSTEGPEEIKIVQIVVNEPEEGKNFKLESECEGKVLKPAEKETVSCVSKVKGEKYEKGHEGTLETLIEVVKTKKVIHLCNAVKMT